jgi:peptidyl-prolyl cis-trans isomerase SurA
VRSKLLSHSCVVILGFGVLMHPHATVHPREQQQVVDEVIAQVNDEIITLSTLRSETKRRIEALVKLGLTEQQANDEVAKHREQLIDTLINDQLLMQKGKELKLSEQVEDEVKQRLAEVATHRTNPTDKKQYEEARATLRMQIMKQTVFEQEVDSKLFAGFSLEELQAYFATHQDKFRNPENVSLSEIFLSFAGKDEAQVKARAEQLVAQLRAGADFARVAAANSDREENGKRLAPTSGGKVGTFELPMLREEVGIAIKDLKVGAVSEPVRTDQGYQILRVDERTPAGTVPVFKQNRVREAMTIERSPKAHEEYLQHLRDEAYVEIAKNYR